MAETSGFSRRAFLRSGLVGVAVLGVSGLGLALQRTKLAPTPKEGLRVLTPEQYSILTAVAARTCPPRASEPGKPPSPGTGPDGIDVALLADRLLELLDDDVKAGVGLALNVLESSVAGALFFERTAPFTQLSPEDQDRVLLAFARSKVALRRTIYRSVSGLTGVLYFGDPRAWPSVGYPGPPSPAGLRTAYAHQLVDFQALRAKG
jgi:hypothetical protein